MNSTTQGGKCVLVTGAAGFIGSHLSEALIQRGDRVVGIDCFDPFYDRSIKESNLSALQESDRFHFVEGDLRDEDALERVFGESSVDAVVHLAAKAGVRPSLRDPIGYVRANVEATVALLEAMRRHDVRKLAFASSSSIYGNQKETPFREETGFESAISIYATSKQSGELFTRMYHNLYGFDAVNLRFFTVYGPRQRPDLAIHKFLKANLKGEEITLFGDGSMARDYTFISDTIQGVVAALDRVASRQGVYETYNLGNSTPVSLKELIAAIEKTTGIPCRTRHEEIPPGDVRITFADISRAREVLGYRPQYPLESGLRKMCDWMVAENLAPAPTSVS